MLERVANIEKVETELNNLIERRALKASGEQEHIEDLWKASCDVVAKRERRETNARRYAWHMDQADRLRRTMTVLIERHEAKASALLEGRA